MLTVHPEDGITRTDLDRMAACRFGDMVKAVVDVSRGIMVLDADLHADEEAELLASGSDRSDLWGVNIYPGLCEEDWLEFDSMINLRPSSGNRSRGVEDPAIRGKIRAVVEGLVRR
jgi:hypothetical protein